LGIFLATTAARTGAPERMYVQMEKKAKPMSWKVSSAFVFLNVPCRARACACPCLGLPVPCLALALALPCFYSLHPSFPFSSYGSQELYIQDAEGTRSTVTAPPPPHTHHTPHHQHHHKEWKLIGQYKKERD
jgi:hypothetical protein